MSEPHLLRVFGTWNGLLIEALRHRDRVDGEIFVGQELRGLEPLMVLVEATRRDARRRGLVELFRVLSAEATTPDHPAHAYFLGRRAACRAALGDTFADLRRTGGLRPGVEPEQAARSVLALVDGVQAQWLLDEGPVDMAGDVIAFLGSLLAEDVWETVAGDGTVRRPGAGARDPADGGVDESPRDAAAAVRQPPAGPLSRTRQEGGRNPTIQDVACATGVSIASVSRALNGKPRVSAQTRARVLAAAAQLGFTGSVAARALKSGRTGRIAVTFPMPDSGYTARVLAGLADELQEAGQSLVVGTTDRQGGSLDRLLERLGRHGLDGAVVILGPAGAEEYHTLLKNETPLVLVDPAGDPGIGVPIIDWDDCGGARRAAEYLLALGHRRIAVVTGEHDLPATRERLRGVAEALTAAGIRLPGALVRRGSRHDPESGCRETLALLSLDRPPTAVIAFEGRIAAGALQAAALAGLDVPDRLSVVGFDDGFARNLAPDLTVVRRPLTHMGGVAARLLLDRLAGDGPRGIRRHLLPELAVRASSGAPAE